VKRAILTYARLSMFTPLWSLNGRLWLQLKVLKAVSFIKQ